MIIQKELTLKDACNEIESLKYDLEGYLAKKNANFLRTQPSAVNPQDIVVDKSSGNHDIFLNYVSKDDMIDTKVNSIRQSICEYQQYIIKKLEEDYGKTRKKEKVKFLKDELNFSFKSIAIILNLSKRQIVRLYGRRKKV